MLDSLYIMLVCDVPFECSALFNFFLLLSVITFANSLDPDQD